MKDLIEVHLRTYRSALRSSKEIEISTLIPTYLKMEPLLHPQAASRQLDPEALSYALGRLPKEILQTKLVILGQTKNIFRQAGFDLTGWRRTQARRRRRRYFFQPQKKILASLVTSISDVDDLVNLLIALEIEVNKLIDQGQEKFQKLTLPKEPLKLKIRLLSGSWTNFAKAVQNWWRLVVRRAKPQFDLLKQPLIFVSSNNHSLINLLDPFCLEERDRILPYLPEQTPRPKIKKNYLVYYASQFAFQQEPKLWQKKLAQEKKKGIIRLPPTDHLPLETQIIPGRLISSRLKEAVLLNIEYPLGFAAFHLLEEVLENSQKVLGVYIMGKAAALNTKPGDILIPKIVFDEHTQNTYLVANCFNNNFPYQFHSGSVLDNQRLVSVLGTFLENKGLFDAYSEKEFNIIEMEAGPYLGAVAQATYPKPLPQKSIVDLHQPPFDLGLIYYSSDNPYTLAKTLGKFLGINAIEATYLTTQAIIDRIKRLD